MRESIDNECIRLRIHSTSRPSSFAGEFHPFSRSVEIGAISPPRFSLTLLGSFALRSVENRTISDLRRKARALLAYLAVASRPYSRHELAAFFCQGADSPLGALRHLFSRLRAVLGTDIFIEQGETIQLNPKRISVDVKDFIQTFNTTLNDLPWPVLAKTIALYQGEFLSGFYLSEAPEFDLWLLGYRTHLHNLYQRGALHLIDRYGLQSQFEAALPLAQQLIQHNPLLEEAHFQLISLYAQTNQRFAALEQYERCRQLLADELAVEPMPALVVLHADILAGRFRVPVPLSASPALPAWTTAADFVARGQEIAQLQSAWAAAGQGKNPVVWVTAEAGGGKTRLVQEFMAILPSQVSFTGQCYESTRTLAYHPWIHLLEHFLVYTKEARWNTLSAPWLDEIARLLPTLAARRISLAPARKQEQLFSAVAALLCLAEQPILLFLDDLQWADAASLQLFHYISEHVTTPMVLIGAYRSEEAEDNPALLALLRDYARRVNVTRLALYPLTSMDIDQLLEQLWPQLPIGYRTPHLRDRLQQATRGNPLFLGEIVRELTYTTHLPDELPVPPSLRDLIQRRLHQLPGSGRQVLESLAVLEQPASLELAQEISARSEDELLQAVELGLRWRLLQMSTSRQIEFSHDLMRQAVGEQLSPVRRRVLHQRTAVALSKHGAKAATLAYHWHHAGDTDQEALYAVRAGDEAATVYAQEEAIQYYESALALLTYAPQRWEVMCNLADIWMLTGKWAEAELMYRQALLGAEQKSDVSLQGRCQTSLGKLMTRKNHHQEALEWLRQARISHTTLGDLKKASQNVGAMGIVHWQLDEYDQALVCYEHALQMTQELGSPGDMAIWIGNIASIHHQKGKHEQAVAGYRQALQIHLASGKKVEVGVCLGNLGNTYRDMGDYQQAWACYEQALQYRYEVGDEAGMAYAVNNLGTLYAQMGNYDAALACFRWVLQIDLKLGQRQNVADDLGQLAEVYLSQEAYSLAQTLLDRSIPLLRLSGGKYYLCQQLLTQAMILFKQGLYPESQTYCQESLITAEGIHPETYFSASLLSVRQNVALGRLSASDGVEALSRLLPGTTEDKAQADIYYEIWSVDAQQESARQRSAELYHKLYADTPNAIYHQRYRILTHQVLTTPAWPELPALVMDRLVNLESLLNQVDQLLNGPY